MIAGTIAQLQSPAQEPLETWNKGNGLPALYVEHSQTDLEGGIAQAGTAASRVRTPELEVGVTHEGKIWKDRHETPEDVHTEWVADVTGTGVICAESVQGDGEFAFPFDLITNRTNQRLDRLEFELEAIATQWDDTGRLREKWMVGADHGDGVSIDYHEDAQGRDAREANVGLGFVYSWDGTVAKGILYQSGYIAIWEDWTASMFLHFVEDELLEHSYVPVDEEEEFLQQSLDDAGDEEADA